MPTPNDVIQRISRWAAEAGGEQYQRLGYAAIEAIRGAQAANDADYSFDARRIDAIVEAMEEDGFGRQVKVLRVHYLAPGLSEADRLARLRRDGLSIGRTAYYIYLEAAHAYVSGALTFGDDNPCAS